MKFCKDCKHHEPRPPASQGENLDFCHRPLEPIVCRVTGGVQQPLARYAEVERKYDFETICGETAQFFEAKA